MASPASVSGSDWSGPRPLLPEEILMQKVEIQLQHDKEMRKNQLDSESQDPDKQLGEPDKSIGKSACPTKALHEQERPEETNDGTTSTKSDKYDDSSEMFSCKQSILKRPKGESPTQFVDAQGPWHRLQPPNLLEIEKSLGSSSDVNILDGESSSSKRSESQEVRFHSVQVRMYGQTLSDNPAVSNGAPIQLDWCYNEHPPIDINLYHAGRTTRPIRQLVLSRYYRHKVLMHWYNFTENEIRLANQRAKKTRKQRQQTNMMADVRFMEGCLWSVTRIVKGMFGMQ
ncbi:unnamed protein product [Cylindrotheca closterium]|uniref:Uncharacterized protein n=1 Tax=Cylindrotheca closterium TaxID=2856 RepID=A0AAD2FGL5_9STRA|nr:unnamed protein product [Cylindrotheca closterium]